MTVSIIIHKGKTATIYNLKYYELLKINDSDMYRLHVKYKDKKGENQIKIIDILNSHEFSYIYY
jgi:succinate dehydrogenase flavin-adding protein (antitoxin of CptAB toxin-antitoxin module)